MMASVRAEPHLSYSHCGVDAMLAVSVAVTEAETVPLGVSVPETDSEGLAVWPRTFMQSTHMTAENLRKGPILSIVTKRGCAAPPHVLACD